MASAQWHPSGSAPGQLFLRGLSGSTGRSSTGPRGRCFNVGRRGRWGEDVRSLATRHTMVLVMVFGLVSRSCVEKSKSLH